MNAVIERGLATHIERWRAAMSGGAARLGWKVGFNVRSVQERLGLPYSLVAGLTTTTRHASGTPHSLSGSMRPVLEAEVAVWLSADVAAEGSEAASAAAITAWAPAIEIVDFNRSFDDLERILAEGIFHRAVTLGNAVPAPEGADLSGHRVRVHHGDALLCELDAREATGHAPAVLLHLARILAPHGEALRAGDIVILGSMNPLTFAEPGRDFAVSIDGLGSVSVALST